MSSAPWSVLLGAHCFFRLFSHICVTMVGQSLPNFRLGAWSCLHTPALCLTYFSLKSRGNRCWVVLFGRFHVFSSPHFFPSFLHTSLLFPYPLGQAFFYACVEECWCSEGGLGFAWTDVSVLLGCSLFSCFLVIMENCCRIFGHSALFVGGKWWSLCFRCSLAIVGQCFACYIIHSHYCLMYLI